VTGLWLEGMRTARRQRGGKLVDVEHKKPRTYRLLSTRRNSGSDRVGWYVVHYLTLSLPKPLHPGLLWIASLFLLKRSSRCCD
jgi:hypothetical protein